MLGCFLPRSHINGIYLNTGTSTTIKTLASYTKSATTVETHYRPKKNQTIIMQSATDIDDSDIDDACDRRPTKIKLAGFVIPWVQTEKSKLLIKY